MLATGAEREQTGVVLWTWEEDEQSARSGKLGKAGLQLSGEESSAVRAPFPLS